MRDIFDLVLACFVGIFCGAITGLIPGIHVNTAGAITFASSVFLLNKLSPEFLAIFLGSMAISHALLEFIPSILLGVPDESTALSVLPGHRMVLQGRAREAIRLVAFGGFGAILITTLSLPFFIKILPIFYSFLKPYIWILLVLGSLYMLIRLNKGVKNFFWSSVLFLFSGIIGWVMLNAPQSSNLSLMCLFTGFFGVSTLIFSMNENTVLPSQIKLSELELDLSLLRAIISGGLSGTILGFLPGFGPAQGTIIAQEISGAGIENSSEQFLTSISGLNTADTLFSLIAIFLIGNPRSGIAVYISQIIHDFSLNHLIFFIFASLTSVSLSLILCLKIGDWLSDSLQGIDYKKITAVAIILMLSIIIIFTLLEKANLPFMILALITSTALGLIPHYLGVSKTHLMGVLIVPAIVVYYGMFV